MGRQAANNHPAWRDSQFVDRYEKTLGELVEEFVPETKVEQIDGLMTREQVLAACRASILRAKESKPDYENDSPFLNYVPRSFTEQKEYDVLRDPMACIVLKPDCIKRGLVDDLSDRLTDRGVRILAVETKQLTQSDVLQLWPTFWTESWWQETYDYMSSGPSIGILCTLDTANGATYDSLKAAKKQLREQYIDLTEVRKPVSLLHTSDSHDETLRNILAFWSQEDLHTILEEA
jgi:nucleoside-diphosphate kinase